jgi:hypothetical protein
MKFPAPFQGYTSRVLQCKIGPIQVGFGARQVKASLEYGVKPWCAATSRHPSPRWGFLNNQVKTMVYLAIKGLANVDLPGQRYGPPRQPVSNSDGSYPCSC